jgi:DNA repair protein RadA/Sms
LAKSASNFVCQSCGAATRKWQGKCDGCGEWNSIVEEHMPANDGPAKSVGGKKGRVVSLVGLDKTPPPLPRLISGIDEFDRALGNGLVPGSATLIGGDPGIGKSTLLLQVAGFFAKAGKTVVYISGEEGTAQISMRAERLGLKDAPVQLAAETNLRNIITTLDDGVAPDVVVIDSIQTVFADTLESAPGTVAQVRASAQELVRFAKRKGTAVLLVGHVTKDGQIAGPRVMEHLVDTVLYFEGDRGHQFRILRAVKNRFGGTDEIGVFEMTGKGLEQVPNPSALFLSNRSDDAAGSAVFAGMEGTRPLLVELQALVASTQAANPRRAVVGWDSGRLAMILAVLDARIGLGFAGSDVYLNVAGGLKISEPAADLASAAALISSLTGKVLPPDMVMFGEIALSGDVRPVSQCGARLKEAAKLGFTKALIPANSKVTDKTLEISTIEKVQDLLNILGVNDE